MSVSKTQWTCNKCGGDFAPSNAAGGSFCGPQCHHEFVGEKVLNQLTAERDFCATTFAKIREQYKPGRYGWSREVFRDEDGNPVEYRNSITDAAKPTEELTAHGREMKLRHASLCPEGALRHNDVIRPTPSEDALRYAENLSRAVETLRHEGKRDVTHDRDTLLAEIRSVVRDGKDVRQADFARALGKAIATARN